MVDIVLFCFRHVLLRCIICIGFHQIIKTGIRVLDDSKYNYTKTLILIRVINVVKLEPKDILLVLN